MRPRKLVGLGQKGRCAARREPVHLAEDLRRLRHGNERLLRQQAAAGESAKKAKFEPASFNEGAWRVSEMCAALKMTEGLLRMEEAPTERARVAQRGACDDEYPRSEQK